MSHFKASVVRLSVRFKLHLRDGRTVRPSVWSLTHNVSILQVVSSLTVLIMESDVGCFNQRCCPAEGVMNDWDLHNSS